MCQLFGSLSAIGAIAALAFGMTRSAALLGALAYVIFSKIV